MSNIEIRAAAAAIMLGFLGNLENSMESVCDRATISSIGAILLPLPPTAPYQGDVLWTNCLCSESLSILDAAELLLKLRIELVKLLREARKFSEYFRGAVFVFACPGMRPNADGSTSRKAYIYEILSEGLSINPNEIDLAWCSQNEFSKESSDADLIRALLKGEN